MRSCSSTGLGLLAVALTGCGPQGPAGLSGGGEVGDTTGDDTTTIGDDTDTTDDSDDTTDDECIIDAEFGSQPGFHVQEHLVASLGDDIENTCADFPIADYAVSWTAPHTGPFRVRLAPDAEQSLTVLRGNCDGAFEGCVGAKNLPGMNFDAIEGQDYTFVVDADAEGWLDLELFSLDGHVCEVVSQLLSAPIEVEWPIANSTGDRFGGCLAVELERRFLWYPPADGGYRVSQIAGNSPSAVTVALDGCDARDTQCGISSFTEPATVVFEAAAHQEILIISEWSFQDWGDVVLNIDPVLDGCGEDLGSAVPVMFAGTTVGFGDDHQGSCSIGSAPERELYWIAPATGIYRFTLEGSSYDTSMYIRDGGCDGVELGCNDDTVTDRGLELWSSLELDLEAGQTVSIFVDGYDGPGDFNLAITQL